MTEIKWQEPPADRRGAPNHSVDDIASRLRERPGSWALVEEGVVSSRIGTWKRRGLQVTARSTGKVNPGGSRLHDVYARFVPEADA